MVSLYIRYHLNVPALSFRKWPKHGLTSIDFKKADFLGCMCIWLWSWLIICCVNFNILINAMRYEASLQVLQFEASEDADTYPHLHHISRGWHRQTIYVSHQFPVSTHTLTLLLCILAAHRFFQVTLMRDFQFPNGKPAAHGMCVRKMAPIGPQPEKAFEDAWWRAEMPQSRTNIHHSYVSLITSLKQNIFSFRISKEVFHPVFWLMVGFNTLIFKQPIMIIAVMEEIHPTNCYWSMHKATQQCVDDWWLHLNSFLNMKATWENVNHEVSIEPIL